MDRVLTDGIYDAAAIIATNSGTAEPQADFAMRLGAMEQCALVPYFHGNFILLASIGARGPIQVPEKGLRDPGLPREDGAGRGEGQWLTRPLFGRP